MRDSHTQAPTWPEAWIKYPLVAHPRGAVLCKEGEPVGPVIWLVEGIVKLVMQGPEEKLLVSVRTPGAMLGSMPVVAGRAHGATVIAMTHCAVRLVPVSVFRACLSDMDITLGLAALWAHEIMDGYARHAEVWSGAESQLEGLFMELFLASSEERRDGSRRLTINISVTELASLICVSRQWASHRLRDWRARGIVARERGLWVAPKDSPILTRLRQRVGS